MKVLSLFDGISCARVALKKAKIPVEAYFASEIDEYAMKISKKNWPEIHQIGDVKTISGNSKDPGQYIFTRCNCDKSMQSHYVGGIDLLIGGSPCQDLSIAKKNRKGLDGDRSSLFWEYVRILKEVKPKYFILENVNSMPKEARDIITTMLGVEPIMIDANLVSAQDRKRLFWTNIPGVTLPKNKYIYLKDIVQLDVPFEVVQYRRGVWRKKASNQKSPTLTANMGTGGHNVPFIHVLQTPRGRNPGGVRAVNGKVPVLTSSSWVHNNKLVIGKNTRKFTTTECERLQCLPDDYTNAVSNSQRYKAIGNGFNVDVIAHILKFIPK